MYRALAIVSTRFDILPCGQSVCVCTIAPLLLIYKILETRQEDNREPSSYYGQNITLSVFSVKIKPSNHSFTISSPPPFFIAPSLSFRLLIASLINKRNIAQIKRCFNKYHLNSVKYDVASGTVWIVTWVFKTRRKKGTI